MLQKQDKSPLLTKKQQLISMRQDNNVCAATSNGGAYLSENGNWLGK